MKKSNSLKMLLVNVLVVFISASTLLGATFAWFTDSVGSANNVIIAGNLDLDVEYTLDGEEWMDFENASEFFKNELWEPGHTEVVALRIKNNGSLALKYTAEIKIIKEIIGKNKAGEEFKLSDYLTVSTLTHQVNTVGDIMLSLAFNGENSVGYENTTLLSQANVLREDTELASGDAHYLLVKIDMSNMLGNEVNHNGVNVPKIELLFDVLARQYTKESDSFGNLHDEESAYPELNIEKVVESGTFGGVDWDLTDAGTLKISPAEVVVNDANCGKVFKSGEWREAVIYNSKGEGVAIGGYPYDVNAVKSLVIEEGVTSIGSFTAKFPNLTGEVVIPSTVKYIGQEAFQNCKITKLTFAEGGTEELCIAPGAFKKLEMEEVVFPADRPAIHVHCWALNDCPNLKTVTFPANVTVCSLWTHVDYCGMSFVNSGDSQILARCWNLETIIFGSQKVHDLFFAGSGNRDNINKIGSVVIEVK